MLARTLGVDLAQLEAALAGCAPDAPGARTRTGLRVDQAAAALSVLTDGRRVSVIDTPAGSGKTWVLTAAGRAWAEAGLGRVIGITPCQSARNALAAGVPESYGTPVPGPGPLAAGQGRYCRPLYNECFTTPARRSSFTPRTGVGGGEPRDWDLA